MKSGSEKRKGNKFRIVLMLATLLWLLTACSQPSSPPAVDLQRIPNNGIHPRIVFDEWGDTHLLYFRTERADGSGYTGNLYYTRYDNSNASWQPEIKVSSEAFDYKDPIYRANMAIDGEGRVHVVWFVDRPARFVYTRSQADRTAFEDSRLIVEHNLDGIDAGADIATDGNRVVLVWGAGDLTKEDQRSVFVLESLDYGSRFGDELMIGDPGLGACACCALSAEFNQAGELLVAYRSAINNTGRHMQRLVVARNAHEDMQTSYQPLHTLTEWELSSCPVTTNEIVRDESDAGDYWLAYENQSQIVTLNMSDSSVPALVSSTASETREKHPSMAFNRAGYQLIAWGEGGGFFSGGYLRRALFDAEGKRIELPALEDIEISDRSFVATMVKPDGNFLILY